MISEAIIVNLGCGEFPASGWVNVDRQPFPGVDFAVDITSLPWGDGQVDLVYAGHVLEHLTYADELPRALAEIHRVLDPNGQLMVVGPDLDRAIARFPDQVPNIWPGAVPREGSPAGACHQWPSTVPETTLALQAAGFQTTEIPIREVGAPWPVVSHIGWQFAISCRPIARSETAEQIEDETDPTSP